VFTPYIKLVCQPFPNPVNFSHVESFSSMTPRTRFCAMAFRINAFCLVLALTGDACSQSLSVTTFAGLSDSGSADGLGLAVRFYLPTSVAVDGAGNVYVADTENDTIRAISPSGIVSTLAGSSQSQGTNNGASSQALFAKPYGVAVDALGHIFVADTYNHTVREIFSGGGTATLAGVAGSPGFRNGPAAPNSPGAGLFNYPYGITVDANENLYVADALNNRIREISHGYVTTLAGGGAPGSLDGVGTNALFSVPVALAVDSAGNVYVADYGNNLIRRVSPLGVVTTLAGSPGLSGSENGVNTGATFFHPSGIAVDDATNLYVADTGNDLIRKITPDVTAANWTVTTLAGTAGLFGDADGTGTNASFYLPQGVAVDSLGNVYVGDSLNRTIRKLTTGGVVSTLAGPDGSYGSADGPGAAARFDEPYGVALDSATNLFVADTYNDTIRRISPAGVVTTLAGLVGAAGASDGTNCGAQFDNPTGVAVDGSGNLYVADYQNSTVRKITPGPGTNWSVSTLAGTAGVNSFSNGPAAGALFNHPYGVAVDGLTNIYVTDYGNQVVRLISSGGAVSTYAGIPGASGYANGAGTNALFDNPAGVALDSSGNLYVADSGNNVVRKIAPGGVTSTIAGEEGVSGSANGPLGLFNSPLGLAVDASNNVFVADTDNNTIREIASGGGLSTVAATARFAGSADGVSNAAQFDNPIGLAVDASGNVYVADVFNNAIRKMAPFFGQALVLTPSPNQSATAGATVTFDPLTAGAAPVTYQWSFDGANIPGATLASLTLTNVQGGTAGSYQLSVSNSFGASVGAATVLSVTAAPMITVQPGALAAPAGSNALLSVTAFGAAPLSYQWSFDGTNLSGATASLLAISNMTSANAGSYQVMVSNSYGSATSLVGSLQLQAPPQVLTPPASQISFPGASVQLSVAAAGMTPLLFQWLKNGTNLINGGHVAGSTTPMLGIGPFSAGDAGQYSVVVSNALGAVTSSAAMLAIGAPGAVVSVFGFNLDVVVPNSASPTDTRTSDYAQPFDEVGQFAFYETNLDAISYSGGTGHTLGLPQSRSFVSQLDGATVFQFASYTANNVLYLTQSAPSGALTLSTAAAFDSLSILAASANGGGNGSFVLEFSDGSSSPPLSFLATDWYFIAASALTHFGRIYCGYYNAFYTDDYPGPAPNLYQTTIDLDALGLNAKPVAAVTFTMPNGPDTTANTTTGIFALSGLQSVALQSPQASGGSINFSFPTLENQSYTIEQTTNLSGGSWQFYQRVTGDGQTMQIAAPLTNSQQFFRVIQP
jgi:sugar lactone lactonase YvrE